jgi:hypothetical protein
VCRTARQPEPRRLDRVLVIDEAKALPRTGLADRRAQRAQNLVDAKERGCRGKVVEVDDA